MHQQRKESANAASPSMKEKWAWILFLKNDSSEQTEKRSSTGRDTLLSVVPGVMCVPVPPEFFGGGVSLGGPVCEWCVGRHSPEERDGRQEVAGERGWRAERRQARGGG